MLLRKPSTTICFILATVAVILFSSFGFAIEGRPWLYGKPSPAISHSPFFGYYPTCWRPFPGDRPCCPSYPHPPTVLGRLPQPSAQPTSPPEAEKGLPAPKPVPMPEK
jgi:hypothetical protein